MKFRTLLFVSLVAAAPLGIAAPKPGTSSSGTTLAATKSLEVCSVNSETWRYFGTISVWNEGVADTQGLTITDTIQNKTGNQFINRYNPVITLTPSVIPKATTLETATVYTYSYEGAPLAGTIRNVAKVTITNHSGSLNKPFGPEPKDTWIGDVQSCGFGCEGPACGTIPKCLETDYPTPGAGSGTGEFPNCMSGCVHSQGYYKSAGESDHEWPTVWVIEPGVTRDTLFYNSPYTWGQVLLGAGQSSSGYYQLAVQYVAAVLNAQTESIPAAVLDIVLAAQSFFQGYVFTADACSTPSACGAQKTDAGTLANYNTGTYTLVSSPIAPPHCGTPLAQ